MLFNSIDFAIFLPIVFFLFWLSPQRFRWLILLVASYYFYMSWNVRYVSLILLATVISYVTALLLEQTQKQKQKKLYVTIAAAVSMGLVFVFKYYNFFADAAVSVLRYLSFDAEYTVLDVLLPVGISFYTFQTMSYVVDVYRGKVQAERHFGKYAAFVSFFPQLVAGPIERTENLLPQIKKQFSLDYDKATYGLKLMAWGFFKKMVIADNAAQYVDFVFGCVYDYTGFTYVIATLLFGIQIYCDFSGYSDIAIGTAKLFGIDLMRNFRSPYFATSVKEFWSRWHISLSTWFRDYVYIPLGGNRCGKWRHCRNLLITFMASGLWHGAAWTFVIWGLLHGVFQVLETLAAGKGKRSKPEESSTLLKVGFSRCWVFLLIMFSWVFFRIPDMGAAAYLFAHILDGIAHPTSYIGNGFWHLGLDLYSGMALLLPILLLFIYDYFSLKSDVIDWIGKRHSVVRWSIYIGFTMLILLLLPENPSGEFIYFQF